MKKHTFVILIICILSYCSLNTAYAGIINKLFGGISCDEAGNISRKGIQTFFNDNVKGAKLLETADSACSNNPDFSYNVGVYYFKTQQFDKAVSKFKDTISSNPNFYAAKEALSLIYIETEINISKGISVAKEAVKYNNSSLLNYLISKGLKQNGDEKWKDWFKKAKTLALNENIDNERQYLNAISITKKSTTMKKRLPVLYAELGLIYERMFDFKKAKDYFYKSNSTYGLWGMGRMHARSGRTDEARDILKDAVEKASILSEIEIKILKKDLRNVNNNLYFFQNYVPFFYAENLLQIPEGEFIMGSLNEIDSAKPKHKVFLKSFLMSSFEVTNTEYKIYVEKTGFIPPYNCCKSKHDLFNQFSINKRITNKPVVNVSWHDAIRYIKWKNKMFNKKYNLPTEAQWEKAARGADSRIYSWGSKDPTLKEAHFSLHWDGFNTFSDVDSHKNSTSPYKIHHMSGNVWEWVYDWFEKYYSVSKGKITRDPHGPKLGDFKVLRGGSWINLRRYIKTTYRNRNWPEVRYNAIGFRLAAD